MSFFRNIPTFSYKFTIMVQNIINAGFIYIKAEIRFISKFEPSLAIGCENWEKFFVRTDFHAS